MTLSVVIATRGRPDLLGRTLAFLHAGDRPDCAVEALVVENGDRQGAEDVLKNADVWFRTTYLHQPRGNKSAALNLAIAVARGERIVFLDDDMRACPGLLVAYARASADSRGGVFFGGPVPVDYEREPPEWLKAYMPGSAVGWWGGEDGGKEQELYFLGGNWAAFRHDLHAAGGFDESLGADDRQAVGEDTNMQQRLRRIGCRPCYLPEAVAWHYIPASRCTPRWALRRAYRHGMGEGLQYSDNSASLWGMPRWMIAELVRRRLRSWMASLFVRDPALRHAARHHYCALKGCLRGIRAAAKVRRPESDGNSNRLRH